ncbi:hypothetical protein KFK09_012806 [Dendrobium nobile]|uniref:SHSP domain-containing protein n=1 Tax=Dendrobium nobile TaxID=94219 RepID=A0A8T3BLV5_DENNO|nr:hypothetical protein KFK09_012806 [Dendrobium nobile]
MHYKLSSSDVRSKHENRICLQAFDNRLRLRLCMSAREMSIIGRRNIFDLFIVNLDPFEGFQCGSNFSFRRPDLSVEKPFSGPHFDWQETPKAHVFKGDLAGLKEDELNVDVWEGSALKISRKRKKDEGMTDTWHLIERTRFSFRLPENTNADNMKAIMENNVLTVTVPKEKCKKPVVKSIQIFR